MSIQENTSFVKHTDFKLFGKVIFSKEEVYTETTTEGQPYKIVLNPDYYKEEFNIGENEGNN